MKISAINLCSQTNFQGQKSNKSNPLKNTAGAAAIALATLVPTQETQAQFPHHHHPMPPHIHSVMPTPVMNIPKCFIYGDMNMENYDKTMRDVFDEIDSSIAPDGQISINEVVRTEERNWNSTNYYPMTRAQKNATANLAKRLSTAYNDEGSNPRTINYKEYRSIMDNYMTSKNVADFIDLMRTISIPHHHHHHHHHHNNGHHRYGR